MEDYDNLFNTTTTTTTTDVLDEYYYGEDDDLVVAVGNYSAPSFRLHWSEMTLTKDEQLVKICIMTFSSFLSILGSGTILFFCRKKLHRIYHRLLFLLSISDLLFSISYIFQPYAIPKHYRIPFGIGSISSCRTVGFFFLTFSLVGCLLNCSLSLYFYMTIVQGKSELYLVRNFEKPWYMICSIVPLSLTVIGLFQSAINPDSYSKLCTFDGTPGQAAPVPGIKLALTWFGIIFLSSVIGFRSTYLVYSKVRDRTKRMERYNFEQQQQQQRQLTTSSNNASSSINTFQRNNIDDEVVDETTTKNTSTTNIPTKKRSGVGSGIGSRIMLRPQSSSIISNNTGGVTTATRGSTDASQKRIKAVAMQAVLYSLVYFNSIIWPSAVGIVSAILSKSTGEFYLLDLALWAFSPLQGFFNFFVYIRPTYMQWRYAYPQKSRLWALWQIWEFQNAYIPTAPSPGSLLVRQQRQRNFAAGERKRRNTASSSVTRQSGTHRVIRLGDNGTNEEYNNNDHIKKRIEQDSSTMESQAIDTSVNNLDILNEMRQENSFIDSNDEEENVDYHHHHHHHHHHHQSVAKLPREDGLVCDDSDDASEDGIVMKEEDDANPKTMITTPAITRRSVGGIVKKYQNRSSVRRNSTMSEGVSAFFDLDLDAAECVSAFFDFDDEEDKQQRQPLSSPLSGFKLRRASEDAAIRTFRGGGNKNRTNSQPTMFTTFGEREPSLQSLPSSSGGGGGAMRSLSSSRRSQFSLTRAWSSFWTHEDTLEGDVKSSTQRQARHQQQHNDQNDMPDAPSKGEDLQDFCTTNHDRDHPHELPLTMTKGMECVSSSPVSDDNQELPSYYHAQSPSLEALENNECHEAVPDTCIPKDPVVLDDNGPPSTSSHVISHPNDHSREWDETSVVSA